MNNLKQEVADILSSLTGRNIKAENIHEVEVNDPFDTYPKHFSYSNMSDLYRQKTIGKFIDELDQDDDDDDDDDDDFYDDYDDEVNDTQVSIYIENLTVNINIDK